MRSSYVENRLMLPAKIKSLTIPKVTSETPILDIHPTDPYYLLTKEKSKYFNAFYYWIYVA